MQSKTYNKNYNKKFNETENKIAAAQDHDICITTQEFDKIT